MPGLPNEMRDILLPGINILPTDMNTRYMNMIIINNNHEQLIKHINGLEELIILILPLLYITLRAKVISILILLS